MDVVPALPTARPPGRPCDPPDELVALRERGPLVPLRHPDGHLGWLVTGHRTVRAILADRRFSSRYELLHMPVPGLDLGGLDAIPAAPLGDLTGVDDPEHARLRRPLVAWFTARRMQRLGARIAEFSGVLLDAMAAAGPPADLVEAYAAPLPARVICAVLGVPYEDREHFTGLALTITDFGAAFDARAAAFTAIHEYLLTLVTAKRAVPTDDVLGELTATDLTDDELAGLGAFVLVAGLDTTAHVIALGTFALLEHPEQLAALRADPDGLAGRAVEELLRWTTVAHLNVRAAVEDVEIEGVTIAAGQTVTLAQGIANRDPEAFGDPDTLDLTRRATGQLAMGHGVHQCLGQHLARTVLRSAIPALVIRFDDLRLAVPPAQVPVRVGAPVHGLRALPLSWAG